ncbi:MAG: DUF2971 domain-containing protein [Desulfobacteraceae bacterium]|nr:DUF2971 domain-containing protein [Desulfobacteraceae bacterium]
MNGNSSRNFEDFILKINEKFDSYHIFCVTTDEVNNLMWAHYGSEHTGFCIEWDKKFIPVRDVKYKNKIANYNLLNFLKSTYGVIDSSIAAQKIADALMVKLIEWKSEKEFRMILGNSMEHLITYKDENFSLVTFQPEWIKSIIFG